MDISKRFLIVSCVCVFILSPIVAAVFVTITDKKETLSTNIEPATKKELFAAIKQTKGSSNASQQFEDITDIVSVKRLDTWWYVATVKLATVNDDSYNPGAQGMLFVKFTNQPNSVFIVTRPGETFSHYNISGSAGVPYDVIDELNEVNNPNE